MNLVNEVVQAFGGIEKGAGNADLQKVKM